MARVKNPLFSEAATGQLGGLLFRNGTYGPIVSRRSITPSLMTPAQCAQRARLKLAHSAWNALTDDNRRAWDAIATYPATGRNTYIRAYTILNKLGYAPHASPNPAETPTAIAVKSAFIDVGPPVSVYAAWTDTGSITNMVLAYTYPTFSQRATPKPSKLIYTGFAQANVHSMLVFPKFLADLIWLRLDIVSPGTGKFFGSTLIRLERP